MSGRRIGVLWVVLSAAAYSFFAVFTKNVLDHLRPADVLFWRFLIAVPVAWAVVLIRAARGGPRPFASPVLPLLAAGVLFGVVADLAFNALDHVSAAVYTVLIYTYPAMVAVGARMLGRRTSRLAWLAIGLTLVGIAMTAPELFDGARATGLGVLLTVLNALAYAIYVLGSARLVGPDATDGLVAAAWSFTGSLAFSAVASLFTGVRAPQHPNVFAGLIGLAIVSTVIAGMSLFLGLGHLGPAPAAMIATIEPVLTLLWAATLLDEHLVPLQIAGAAVVIGGVVLAQRASPVAAVEPG